jgi:hypothetical protein
VARSPFSRRSGKSAGEIFQILARGGIDDADAVERNVQALGDRLHLFRLAEHDGRAQPQRVKLPRGLQNARLLAFGKHHPLRMPLQFFDDIADETHPRPQIFPQHAPAAFERGGGDVIAVFVVVGKPAGFKNDPTARSGAA